MLKKSIVLNLFVFVFILVASVFTLLPHQVQAGWTEQTSSGSRNWYSITSSSDGTKLAAVVNGGYIYTSTDSGATWTAQTSAGSRYWDSITSSSDGTKLAAVVNGGYIYTSTDSGVTWVQRTSDMARPWISITSSSDGTKLAATDWFSGIYTSIDSGVNWIQKKFLDGIRWGSITSSSDGTKLAEVSVRYFDSEIMQMVDGVVYTYNNSGDIWTRQTSAGLHDWSSVASSSDGTKLIAVSKIPYNSDTGLPMGGGYIYTSIDSGATWTDRTPIDSCDWYSTASSSDGTKLAAVVSVGYIYTSIDSGYTWKGQTSAGSRQWHSIASSSDGTKLAAVVKGGYIYTYIEDDTTPNSFTFTDQTGVSFSTPTESNTITIAGINASTPISISSCTSTLCEYKINSGDYTSTAGNVVNGDTVTVRQTSSDTNATTTDLTLGIGGVTDTFSVTTKNATTYHRSSGGYLLPQFISVTPSFINCPSGYLFDTNTGKPCTVITPIETPTITRILKYGMIGDDVKQLQVYLNIHNYLISLSGAGSLGKETTSFGSLVKKAVIKFQLDNGLVGDGVVGKMTRALLK